MDWQLHCRYSAQGDFACPRMRETFHDDKTHIYDVTSSEAGLGDRTLNVWAMLTLARLAGIPRVTSVWGKVGKGTVPRAYTPTLMLIPGIDYVGELPQGVVSDRKVHLQDVICCGQGMYVTGYASGSVTPRHIFDSTREANKSWLSRKISVKRPTLEQVMATWRSVVSETKPSDKIGAYLIGTGLVGIHLRRSDKVVVGSASSLNNNTQRELGVIEARAITYIRGLISAGQKRFFLAADEPAAARTWRARLLALGASDVQTTRSGPLEEFIVADLFNLARCTQVLQVTKYSTFSMVAALIGNVPLVNFYGPEGNQLRDWMHVVDTKFHTPNV